MTKRILKVFILLALAVGLYMTVNVKADGVKAQPTNTAQATNAPSVCNVQTGIDNGAVNLRGCAGTWCEVKRILTEGERLNILQAGNWTRVTTEDGVTGYINSTYCKGK